MMDTYLTPNEAGALLRRKPWPILQAIYRGELRAFQRAYVEAWDATAAKARRELVSA